MKTILIIDDEQTIVSYLVSLLEKKNYKAMGFYSGNECIDYLKAGGLADLIISDFKMKNGDGMIILDYIKQHKKNIPFMFMTGFSDLNFEEMVQAGAHKVFTKPFKLSDAMIDIKEALNESIKENQPA